MSAMDAIYHHRSVCDYAPGQIDQAVIRSLLDAAVHSSISAVHVAGKPFLDNKNPAVHRVADGGRLLPLLGHV